MGIKHVENLTPINMWSKRKETDEVAREVAADISVTRNLGDYNSVKVGIFLKDDVADGESLDEAAERIFTQTEGLVEAKLAEYEDE